MAFIQIIELTTNNFDEVEALMDEWIEQTQGKRLANRATVTEDRERPNTFVQIVEFLSYEQAMENSNLPETSDFAERIAKLCQGPLSFRNLDVRRVDELS